MSNIISRSTCCYDRDLTTYDSVVLTPSCIDGKSVLSQNMINSTDTKYIIKYDFDLGSKEVTLSFDSNHRTQVETDEYISALSDYNKAHEAYVSAGENLANKEAVLSEKQAYLDTLIESGTATEEEIEEAEQEVYAAELSVEEAQEALEEARVEESAAEEILDSTQQYYYYDTIRLKAGECLYLNGATVGLDASMSEKIYNKGSIIYADANTTINIGSLEGEETLEISHYITVPERCILEFDGGSLNNGVLVGTNTKIIAPKVAIFSGITIDGTWNVPDITSAWFSDATENNVLKQAFNLTNAAVHNVVTIEDGTYNVSCLAEKEAPININSNTNVNLIGRIKLIPNSLYYGYVVNIVYGSENISIYGNGVIEGDKFKHDYQTGALALGNKIMCTNASNTPKDIVLYTGNEQITGTLEVTAAANDSVYWVRNKFNDTIDPSGETGYTTTNYTYYRVVSGKWKAVNTCESCHGINIHECYNVSISNITIEKCAGDCIYIGYKTKPANRVSMTNLVLDNGRRQGISVTSAENLLIDNCNISNINGTAPQAGIDIEPNANSVITNFAIRNTTIKNVDGAGLAMHNTKINGLDNISIENVIIDGCKYGIGNRRTDIHGLSIKNVTVTNNSSYGIVLQPYENVQVEEPEPYNVRDSVIENFMCEARHDNVDSWTNIIMGINISVNNCTFNGQTLVRSYLYTDNSHEERGIAVSNCTFNAISNEESLANSSQTVQIHNACSVIGGTIICKHLRLPNGYVSIRDAKIIVDTISSSVYSSVSPSGSRFNTIENSYLECPNVYLGYNCSLVRNTLVLWYLKIDLNSVIKSNIITFTGNGKNLPNNSNILMGNYCDISFNRITADNGGRSQENKNYPVKLGQYNSFRHNVYTLTQASDEQNNPITTELAAFLYIGDYDDVSFNKFIISGTSTFVWRLFYAATGHKSTSVLFSNTYDYEPALVEGEGYVTNYCAYRDANKNRFGTSEERPELTNLDISFEYYDTILGKPIWWDGTNWVDSTGTVVN